MNNTTIEDIEESFINGRFYQLRQQIRGLTPLQLERLNQWICETDTPAALRIAYYVIDELHNDREQLRETLELVRAMRPCDICNGHGHTETAEGRRLSCIACNTTGVRL